jgi:hypothetical protein
MAEGPSEKLTQLRTIGTGMGKYFGQLICKAESMKQALKALNKDALPDRYRYPLLVSGVELLTPSNLPQKLAPHS